MSNNDDYSCPPYNTYNMIPKERTQSYKQWFVSPIYHINYDNAELSQATHGDYIRYFYNHITRIINTNQMNIKNEKEFRKEIATFIYRLSDENRECRA